MDEEVFNAEELKNQLKLFLKDVFKLSDESIEKNMPLFEGVFNFGLNAGIAQVELELETKKQNEAAKKAGKRILRPNQHLEGNVLVTQFNDGWGLRQVVDPELYIERKEAVLV